MKWWFLAAVLAGFSGHFGAVAELPSAIREAAIPDPDDPLDRGLVNQMCHSGLEYTLLDWQSDDEILALYANENNEKARYQTAKNRFHRTVNCLLNDAMEQTILTTNARVNQAYSAFSSDPIPGLLDPKEAFPEDEKQACEGIRVGAFSALQQQSRERAEEDFTVCNAAGTHPKTGEAYSACRVAEVLLTEYCGYGFWLDLSAEDNAAARFTHEYEREINPNSAAENGPEDIASSLFVSRFERLQQRNRTEAQHAKQAVEEAVRYYRDFNHAYRLHAALRLQSAMTTHCTGEMHRVERQLSTFPDQFKYHMQKTCTPK